MNRTLLRLQSIRDVFVVDTIRQFTPSQNFTEQNGHKILDETGLSEIVNSQVLAHFVEKSENLGQEVAAKQLRIRIALAALANFLYRLEIVH